MRSDIFLISTFQVFFQNYDYLACLGTFIKSQYGNVFFLRNFSSAVFVACMLIMFVLFVTIYILNFIVSNMCYSRTVALFVALVYIPNTHFFLF